MFENETLLEPKLINRNSKFLSIEWPGRHSPYASFFATVLIPYDTNQDLDWETARNIESEFHYPVDLFFFFIPERRVHIREPGNVYKTLWMGNRRCTNDEDYVQLPPREWRS